jgi:hypothetical protein
VERKVKKIQEKLGGTFPEEESGSVCEVFIGTPNSIMPGSLFLSLYLFIWLVRYHLLIFPSTLLCVCAKK